jgi:hypothetical protein
LGLQSCHPAIAIAKRVDPRQPVVRRRQCEQPVCGWNGGVRIESVEAMHEIAENFVIRRGVATDVHIVGTEFTRLQRVAFSGKRGGEPFFRRQGLVEFPVKPLDEFRLEHTGFRLFRNSPSPRRFRPDVGHAEELVATVVLAIRKIVP